MGLGTTTLLVGVVVTVAVLWSLSRSLVTLCESLVSTRRNSGGNTVVVMVMVLMVVVMVVMVNVGCVSMVIVSPL